MIAANDEQLKELWSAFMDLSCTSRFDSPQRDSFDTIARVIQEVRDELKPTELERRVADLEARIDLVSSYVEHAGNWGTYDNRRLLLRKMLDGSITEWGV